MAIAAHGYGTAEIPPGAVNLHPYPGLVYAPAQHGEGIRFAHNGRPVEDVIAVDVSHLGLIAAIDAIARELGVSFGDACDGLKYLRDNKAI